MCGLSCTMQLVRGLWMDTNEMTLPLVGQLRGGIPLPRRKATSSAQKTSAAMNFHGIYWFRIRHPFVYGLSAFIIGGGFVAIFTMTTYKNWDFEGIDLVTAFYQIIAGGLGGGIITAALAFVYTGAIGPGIPPMKSANVIRAGE